MRRRTAHGVATALGALLGFGGLLGVGGIALAPAGAQTADDVTAPDHLTLVSQTPWVAPDGALDVVIDIQDAPRGATLRRSVHDRVRSRTELARSLSGDDDNLRARLGTAATQPVAPHGNVSLRVDTAAGIEGAIALPRDGVYPLVLDLLDADGELLDRLVTHLVRLPAPDPARLPLDVAVVVPLHAPPAHTEPGVVDADAVSGLDGALAALEARPGAVVTLTPTPETVEALASIPDGRDLVAALATEPRHVVSGAFVRIDADQWVDAGLAGGLARQVERGGVALEQVLGPVDRGTWVVEPGATPSTATLATLATLGVRSVVLPGSAVDGEEATTGVPFRLPIGGGAALTAVVADDDASAHAGASGDGALDAHHLLADLAVAAGVAPDEPRALVVDLPVDGAADPDFLVALLDGLSAGAGFVRPVTVTDVLARVPAEDAAPPALAGDDQDDDTSYVGFGRTWVPLADDTASLASTFGGDDPATRVAADLLLVAGSADNTSAERRAGLATVRRLVDERLATVTSPERQRVTLTGRDGEVQLVVTNTSGRPANVVLRLQGERLDFPAGTNHPVRLEGETTIVELQVETRSSGDAFVDVEVATADGRLMMATTRVTVRSTALSGVGLALMAASLVVLATWWTRTIVRERRRSRHRHPAHSATGPGEAPDEPAT